MIGKSPSAVSFAASQPAGFINKLYVGLQDPDFNYTIRSAPAEYRGVTYYLWYLSVIPRLTRVAGFVLPEAGAEYLRKF